MTLSFWLTFLRLHAAKILIGFFCLVLGCQCDLIGRARAYRRGYRNGRESIRVRRSDGPESDCVEFRAFRPDGTEIEPLEAEPEPLEPIPYPDPIPDGYSGGCN